MTCNRDASIAPNRARLDATTDFVLHQLGKVAFVLGAVMSDTWLQRPFGWNDAEPEVPASQSAEGGFADVCLEHAAVLRHMHNVD